ncbi:glycoside hydrolase family 36 protein [Levilactobacillus cerevisiae]|uniref:glycoside hydrolase family 36 protein n=1 Tax=Levilactobacillus cerevisiae TaxID=1704076 RepID=UPI00345EA87C
MTEQDSQTGLVVQTFFQLYHDTVTIRTWKTVTNQGTANLGLEYVASLAYTGLMQADAYQADFTVDNTLHIANNSWTAELQWQTDRLKDLGLTYRADGDHQQASSKRISITNNSSWSCSEYSPNAILTNDRTGQVAMWQLENNGAWHYELSDTGRGDLLNLQLAGPEEYDTHWWKELKPTESFTTIAVAFAQLGGNAEAAIQELTTYRRLIRRPNADNVHLPVIFNDYMNGLMGDPTTKAEIPLINAAAKTGCDYFVIDCGWYADGYWWDSVGEWLPSAKRFPEGIEQLTGYIREKGMVPGLWLEIEAMGINCPLADKLPDDWFFMRHGKRVIDVDRYHLDFRNPAVIHFADQVVNRLVNEYHVGYIKMDYNITTGIGSDVKSDSVGDALLTHNRAYIDWLDQIFAKYPELVIENCGSGGMRHDYVMLQRHSIQSLTDQTNYLRNGAISAAGVSAVTPEQCAVWSYPLANGDEEETIYNMVNAMLVRIHQSGYLNRLSASRLRLVQQGIAVYKTYREQIPLARPVWPLGMGHIDDDQLAFGLQTDTGIYLAVWQNSGSRQMKIDLTRYGDFEEMQLIYPQEPRGIQVKQQDNQLHVAFPQQHMARLFWCPFK